MDSGKRMEHEVSLKFEFYCPIHEKSLKGSNKWLRKEFTLIQEGAKPKEPAGPVKKKTTSTAPVKIRFDG